MRKIIVPRILLQVPEPAGGFTDRLSQAMAAASVFSFEYSSPSAPGTHRWIERRDYWIENPVCYYIAECVKEQTEHGTRALSHCRASSSAYSRPEANWIPPDDDARVAPKILRYNGVGCFLEIESEIRSPKASSPFDPFARVRLCTGGRVLRHDMHPPANVSIWRHR